MDFLYLSFALLLSVTMCVGQTEETPTEPEEPPFEVKIYPELTKELIAVGSSKMLTCVVSATAGADPPQKDELTYEWTKDGVPVTNEDKAVSPYVQMKSNGYSLRIVEVTETDAGVYKCTVTSASYSEPVFKEMQLEIFEPLVVQAEEEQFGILGEDGDIICKATSQPPPEISWKDPNGDDISGTTEKYILSQDKLTVRNLEFSDKGHYVCEVSILTSGTLKAFDINYDVVETPHIPGALSIQPDNPKVGDEVKITCKAEGTPAPTYAFKRGETLMPSTQVDSTQGILTLPELKREDEADYTCIATNKGGFIEKSGRLDVLIPPELEPMGDVPAAVEGSPTSVICKASGDPEPGIAWRKKGMEVDYNEGTQVGGPTIERTANSLSDAEIKEVELEMSFTEIKAENAGEYECSAFNSVGRVSASVTIEVQYAPIFKEVNGDNFYGWKGHQANLTCQVSANPAATILWKQANADDPTKKEEIMADTTYTIGSLKQDGHISTSSLLVTISADDVSVYKDYICEANNVQDKVEKTLTLTEATAPGAPLVQSGRVLSNMATFLFEKPGNNGGKPVTAFVYKYVEEGGNPSEAVTVEASTSGQTKVELTDLKPSTNYVIHVQARSLVGPGAEQSVTFETLAVSAPLRLILTSSQYGQDAESYRVQWQKPNDGGSPITSFIIRYRQVEVTGSSPDEWTIIRNIDEEFKTDTVENSAALDATLQGLVEDSFYELNVVAVNSEGDSEIARRIVKTSKAASSAGLGSGLIIGIIIGIIVFILIIILVVFILAKRRPRLLGGKGGDEERGQADGGKAAAAEEEKLIQKDDKAKVENETEDVNKDAVVEEKPEEFEPDTKPEAPAEVPADKPADVPAVEVKTDAEVPVTPAENSTA